MNKGTMLWLAAATITLGACGEAPTSIGIEGSATSSDHTLTNGNYLIKNRVTGECIKAPSGILYFPETTIPVEPVPCSCAELVEVKEVLPGAVAISKRILYSFFALAPAGMHLQANSSGTGLSWVKDVSVIWWAVPNGGFSRLYNQAQGTYVRHNSGGAIDLASTTNQRTDWLLTSCQPQQQPTLGASATAE